MQARGGREGFVVKISSDLPKEIKIITYAKNSHYIKLEDYNGAEWTGLDKGIMRYYCNSCKRAFYTESNYGDIICPVCHDSDVIASWGTIQLAFIPEVETKFTVK